MHRSHTSEKMQIKCIHRKAFVHEIDLFVCERHCLTQYFQLTMKGNMYYVNSKKSLHGIKRSVEASLPVHVLPILPLHHLVHRPCSITRCIPSYRLKMKSIKTGSLSCFPNIPFPLWY